MTPKKLGIFILLVFPTTAIAYTIGLFTLTRAVEEYSLLSFMLVLFGLFTWIGFTMYTEPSTSRPIPVANEDLEPETINSSPANDLKPNFSQIIECSIGEGTLVRDQVNLYKCQIGRDCRIESFVYIEEGVVIGDRVKIKPNVFIPTGITIEDDVFIGPNATFTNDKHPRVNGSWKIFETNVGRGASIGAHAVILPGVTIGPEAVVGAGSVVTKDVAAGAIVVGNPARAIAWATPYVSSNNASVSLNPNS